MKDEKHSMHKINKKELARKVKAHLGMQGDLDTTITKIEEIMHGITESVISYLKEGKEMFWSGMGSFVIKQRKATRRKNPQNGKEIKIPAKEVVRVRLFKSFTDKCIKSTKKGK
jgi:DNA-binding protein HU-beta